MLFALYDMVNIGTDCLDAFLLSAGSASQLQRNLKLLDSQFHSTFQGLQKHGYIKRINENQFLITPKAFIKIHRSKIEEESWNKGKWDGFWRIISFDIPELKRQERDLFRSILKRKGFIGLQNSVFISPHANFEDLAQLRADLKIEKYVTFFISKTYTTDDDSDLRRKFDL